jgi:hypothetical protein
MPDRDHSLRMQGAARVLAILAKDQGQTDTAATVMETLGISDDDLNAALAAKSDRLIPSLNDVELLRAILEAQPGRD